MMFGCETTPTSPGKKTKSKWEQGVERRAQKRENFARERRERWDKVWKPN